MSHGFDTYVGARVRVCVPFPNSPSHPSTGPRRIRGGIEFGAHPTEIEFSQLGEHPAQALEKLIDIATDPILHVVLVTSDGSEVVLNAADEKPAVEAEIEKLRADLAAMLASPADAENTHLRADLAAARAEIDRLSS